MSEWRPIETAPSNEWVLACWADKPQWPPSVLKLIRKSWTDEDDGDYRQPTHWMPLPAPPEAA